MDIHYNFGWILAGHQEIKGRQSSLQFAVFQDSPIPM